MDQNRMNHKPEVLIIGGGIIGLCSVYFLAKQGREVTLIEQGDIGAGSSYGNAGLIVPSHITPLAAPGVLWQGIKWMFNPESPFFIKPRLDRHLISWLWQFRAACTEEAMRHGMGVLRQLSVESAALFEEIITAENLTCYYEHAGNLSLYKTEHAFEEAAAEARLTQEYGVTIEILDGDEVRAKEPAAASDIVGGVYLPEDAYLDPALFIQGLADSVEKYNGTICTRTEVLGFEVSGKGIQRVKTTRGDFQPEQVVLAVGSWSPKLGQALRLNLPVQPAKGYSITVKRPESGPRTALMLGEARMAVTPMGPNLRFAGTLEMAGLNFDINQRRVEVLRRSANSYLNGNPADNELVEVWRGLRPCTPDGLPIIGLSDSINNLIVATGHATLGVSQGPISGKLVSQIVSGENASVPLESLRPGRFG